MVFVNRIGLMVLGEQNDGRKRCVRMAAVDLGDRFAYACRVIAILADHRARGCGDLDEGETSYPTLLDLEEPGNRVEALEHALGVVEPVDADADAVRVREAESLRVRFACASATLGMPASASGGHSMEIG